MKFGDIIEGVTMQEQLDEVTGFTTKVIAESKDPEARPRVSIKDDRGRTLPGGRYLLPMGAHIVVAEGDMMHQGDVIAKIPRETTKTKDITGGLPRVAELFEARKPKEYAIISEITGSRVLRQGHEGKTQGDHYAGSGGRRKSTPFPRESISASRKGKRSARASP